MTIAITKIVRPYVESRKPYSDERPTEAANG